MSAFLCSARHLSALANALEREGWSPNSDTRPLSRFEVFELLKEENLTSLDARYGEGTDVAVAQTLRYDPLAGRTLEVVQILKLVNCYEYQACEDDGWFTSQAREYCADLKEELIHRLPGYDEADWGID